MEELSEILKNNMTEDLTCFYSLSESELDLLISLKKLAIQRAKISGYEELADKFDLKNLRALGLVVMDYVRKKVQDDTSLAASVVHQLRLLDNYNLLGKNSGCSSAGAQEDGIDEKWQACRSILFSGGGCY